jgi:D-aminoacyl-tRNA deacylase
MFSKLRVRKITILIISSKKDPAGCNIKKGLLKHSEWKEINSFEENPAYQNSIMKNIVMITIKDRTIRHENLDEQVKNQLGIQPKQAVFITRHRSKTGEPTLTTHPIGNYGKAEFGGRDKTLSPSSPRLMTELLRIIKNNSTMVKTYHKVCFEVTHHGPYMSIPTFFAEVGSSEEEWKKQAPADIIAKSLLDLFENYFYEEDLPKDIPVLVGIGGGHYAPRFSDIVFEKKASFGHMIPSYHIDAGNINGEMFEEAIRKTPGLKGVYIHKKSLKKSLVSEYKRWFKEHNISVVSSKELENL